MVLFHVLGNSTLGYRNTPSLWIWFWWVMTNMGHVSRQATLSEILSKDEAHIWFVPLVIAGLFWHKRQEFMTLPKRVWWPGFGLLVLAVGLHVVGFMVQQTRISFLGFFLGLYALGVWIWGPRWAREALFPFLLFGFCVPLGNSVEFITFPLRILSAEASTLVSRWLLGLDVFRDGTGILSANGRFKYDVAPACSGIRSLVTLMALTTVFGYLSFQKLWKRGLMLSLAAPLAVAGNTVRITCAVLVGEVFGQTAGLAVEQKLGFLTFVLALVVMMFVAHWLREDAVPRPVSDASVPEGVPSSSAVPTPTPPG